MSETRLQRIQEQLKENPSDAFALFALAKELEKSGKCEEAHSAYQNLLNINPDYLGAYYHYGKILELLGADNEAIEVYSMGIEKSKKLNDRHTLAELQNAYQNLLIELDE